MNAPQVPAWAASTYDFASWTDATNLIGGTWQLPLESHGSLGVIRYGDSKPGKGHVRGGYGYAAPPARLLRQQFRRLERGGLFRRHVAC